MLICQPALSEMDVELSCCSNTHGTTVHSSTQAPMPEATSIPPIKIEEGGLTLGHLYDGATKLASQHSLCPYATVHDHGEDGYVEARPTFCAKVTLRQDDPVLAVGVRLLMGEGRMGLIRKVMRNSCRR